MTSEQLSNAKVIEDQISKAKEVISKAEYIYNNKWKDAGIYFTRPFAIEKTELGFFEPEELMPLVEARIVTLKESLKVLEEQFNAL